MTRCCARLSRRMAAGCSSTPGDGVCAAFASPRCAVDAAVAAQQALELPVPMGLATGEAELREGDYFGAVLNRAARVMAAGHGGQILLADSTAVLLTGVDLVDLGPRRLRDVSVPVGVFQVRARGPAHGVSVAANAGCDTGEPAASDHQLHRARVRGRRDQGSGAGTSVAHVDRRGRGRQDTAGVMTRVSGSRTPDAQPIHRHSVLTTLVVEHADMPGGGMPSAAALSASARAPGRGSSAPSRGSSPPSRGSSPPSQGPVRRP